jgi:putative transposase
MRLETFAEKEHYHVFARGNNKTNIFIDDHDRTRFIFLITHLQSPVRVSNISWYTNNFLKKNSFNTKKDKVDEILKTRHVKLVAFALMSNHFHLLIENLEDSVLSVYMHRVLTAYGKYFNTKYHKKGHVFEGPFGAVHIKNNTQLLHLSTYIHKNPKELAGWDDTYNQYPWSSYQDYIGQNRWGYLIAPQIILEQFKDQSKYEDFVINSIAKESLI